MLCGWTLVVANPDPAALYASFYRLLHWIATAKYRIPEADAGALIHEVFLSYVLVNRHLADVERWLVGGICNQSRNYWRQQLRDELSPAFASDPRTVEFESVVQREYTLAAILRGLDPRCRTLLYRHYFEEHTARELASSLRTSVRYAQRLLHKCLVRARARYTKLEKGSGG